MTNIPFLRVPTIGLATVLPAVLGCDRTLAGGFGSLILPMVVSQRSTSRKLSGAAVELVEPVEPSLSLVELVEESVVVEVSPDVEGSVRGSDDGAVESFDETWGEELWDTIAPAPSGILPVTDLESIEGDGWNIAIVVPPIATKVTRLPIITLGFLINDRRDSGSIMSCAPSEKVPVALCKNLQDKS